ncbi:bifunctional phosphopantothenoylcysteine decarboxylase/phosphopantothenate--cysteine ligase CoaBC [Hyphomicrobiales bacterium]|jgi:phosphopantothenoylcysteine decarboxylase/phosphopantothenate--cysteine ligase|nr:bifunctional phosphopantothenoylcysteine decarboxylase/phosphopantothenate--cysteine ligase CoaBC [Hyphomicrobiales bacterium]|tara:strand:+ start:20 stop:1219 length:1200 start_codon:yes stop_codon:yes gene_type:complete
MKKILLIVSGGIAAYRSLDLIREIKRRGDDVTCVLTKSATQFVQPLSFGALSQNKVYTDLFDLESETNIGHIKLSRNADLVVLAPATANILAKMSYGISDSLATSILLANNKPLLIAPSMNVKMWNNPSTKNNIEKLKKYGHIFVGPDEGEMACGEVGSGKMSKVEDIYKEIEFLLKPGPLKGKKALVTSGPTIEPIDPVRFISNKSSGKQGHAIAERLSKLGADTHLITGPVNIPYPDNVRVTEVNTAEEMLNACKNSIPADIAIFAAAVSDWKPTKNFQNKIKKSFNDGDLNLSFSQNPDILRTISETNINRPKLIVGFTLETENLMESARKKMLDKSCDWMIANNHIQKNKSVFNSDMNEVSFLNDVSDESWGLISKKNVAENLCIKIIEFFDNAA